MMQRCPLRQALPNVKDLAAVSDLALNVESFSAFSSPSARVSPDTNPQRPGTASRSGTASSPASCSGGRRTNSPTRRGHRSSDAGRGNRALRNIFQASPALSVLGSGCTSSAPGVTQDQQSLDRTGAHRFRASARNPRRRRRSPGVQLSRRAGTGLPAAADGLRRERRHARQIGEGASGKVAAGCITLAGGEVRTRWTNAFRNRSPT